MSNTEDHIDLGIYEIGYSILPSVAEDKLSVVVEKIKKAIQGAGGNEIDGEDPRSIPLSYTMSKTIGARKYVADDAFFGWLKFEIEPENVNKVKVVVEKIDEVLRFLLIKTPRETSFTFAAAEKALEEAEKARAEAARAAEEPKEAPATEGEPVVE